jgi:uncharacterized protein YyaL (SSP411 family)
MKLPATFSGRRPNRTVALFGDEDAGGFYFYGNDVDRLIARPRTLADGAMPSGNSVAALNLLRLSRLTGEPRYRKIALRQMEFFARDVGRYPQAYTFFLTALQVALGPFREMEP